MGYLLKKNNDFFCIHLFVFAHVLNFVDFFPVGLGPRRNTGGGISLYLVLPCGHTLLYARINLCTFKTLTEYIKSWAICGICCCCLLFFFSFSPSGDCFCEITMFSSASFPQQWLTGFVSLLVYYLLDLRGKLKNSGWKIWAD